MIRSISCRLLGGLVFGCLGFGSASLHAVPEADLKGFAREIDAFDAADAKNPPEKGGIVFAGSSSIRLLNLKMVFPGLKALNRGFGGSRMPQMNQYLERCVLRYEPKTVVFYAGGNDLWDGTAPEAVAKEFQEMCRRIFERMPKARLIVLAVRPSPARESIRNREAELNSLYKEAAAKDPRMIYLSGSWDRFLDADGKPIAELYVPDRLHMSDAGYEIWKEMLTPHL